ncbi:unnamed protein product [Trichobilharzia szidati]|nr:unnamed protein product [Trichobilharzia szidati]
MRSIWRVRFSYAIGHVLNDLCASVWFTYTLVFFKFGIGIPTSMAGLIVLVGQVVDGLVTPLIGVFSDKLSSQSHVSSSSSPPSPLSRPRTSTSDSLLHNSHQPLKDHEQKCIPNYRSTATTGSNSNGMDDSTVTAVNISRTSNPSLSQRCQCCLRAIRPFGRKIWHLGGSALIIFSFPLIFGPPLGSSDVSTLAKMIYYLPLVAIFQTGWAAVQITHLALMNELSLEPSERTLLTSLRYLFTVISNLVVYISTFLLLEHQHSVNSHIDINTSNNIMIIRVSPTSISFIDFGKDDIPAFQKLGFTIIGIGGLTTLLFHIGIRPSDIVSNTRSTSNGKYR